MMSMSKCHWFGNPLSR